MSADASSIPQGRKIRRVYIRAAERHPNARRKAKYKGCMVADLLVKLYQSPSL
jgi:hypothetical protein